MKRSYFMLAVPVLLILGALFPGIEKKKVEKINGVNFVGPPKPIPASDMQSIKQVNANWVAIVPYAFSRPGEPFVNYNYSRQWWGERKEGVVATIRYAQTLGFRIMLKPHVWVMGQGWAGDFALQSEQDWQDWERDYEAYVLAYARIADSMKVDLLCIGTEYRKAVVARAAFWKSLISKTREIYEGKLTYAANWDNYQSVTFWDQLDYIGIDAYFPICNHKTPQADSLVTHWSVEKENVRKLHSRYDLPVIFTEYGYQSIDYTAGDHWKLSKDTLAVNLKAQANAYEGLYRSFWNEDWFAGGFLWKWHARNEGVGGSNCKRFTPQNKPASAVISSWYSQ